MKKGIEISTEILLQRNRDLRNRYNSPLIKWYRTNLTKREKYEYGLMSYEEFLEWQNELMEAEKEREENAALEEAGVGSESAPNSDADETTYHTFWEGDDADRENISNASYEEFLAQNGIDVSNANAVNLDAIF